MNIENLAGVNAYRRTAASEKLQKAVKPRGGTSPGARTRDRVELQFSDVLAAEKEGYIEAGGSRYAVSGDMAAQMRAAYDMIAARNEALIARQTAQQNAKAADRQTKALAEQGKAMQEAMEIARRIAKGGRVPPEDERFLMEYSPEMYMAAKMEALAAKKHEKYDSVLGDEEEGADGEEADVEIGEGTSHLEASVSDGAVDGLSVVANETGAGAE